MAPRDLKLPARLIRISSPAQLDPCHCQPKCHLREARGCRCSMSFRLEGCSPCRGCWGTAFGCHEAQRPGPRASSTLSTPRAPLLPSGLPPRVLRSLSTLNLSRPPRLSPALPPPRLALVLSFWIRWFSFTLCFLHQDWAPREPGPRRSLLSPEPAPAPGVPQMLSLRLQLSKEP